MGCAGSVEVAASAPNYGANFLSEYKGDGPWYTMSKDAVAKINYAADGPASNDEKVGTPPQIIPALFKAAVATKGEKVALRVERLDEKGSASKFGKAPALVVDGKKKTVPESLPASEWTTWTYNEFYADCNAFAKSLIERKVQQFGTVAIWGFNSPEWMIAMMGGILMGAKAAGIYPTDTPDQVKYKCKHSEADVLVVEDMKKYNAVKSIAGELPDLKAVVMWGATPPEKVIERKNDMSDVAVYTWQDFLASGKGVEDSAMEEAQKKIKPGHCAALIYTSGTTGFPKAVMISHDNLIFESNAVSSLMPIFGANAVEERIISYLPLSHIAGMLVDVIFPMFCTATKPGWFMITFARPYDLKLGSLKDRLVATSPTLFIGVPRVWEKIAEKMSARAATITGLKKKIATWAKGKGLIAAKNKLVGGSGALPCCYGLADKLILSKVKLALGLTEMKIGLTAAAPIGKHTLEYYGALGIDICEVYGMSESTGGTTGSTPTCHLWGSCGFGVPGVEVKVFKVDEKDINVKKECPPAKNIFEATEEEQGEICFRGRSIMMGYMANPKMGEEHVALMKKKNEGAIDKDGWMHSGDKGCISESGMLKITGRYKELIIGAGGENVAPVPLESNIKKICPIISNIMMYGDKKKYNVCIVSLKTKGATGAEPGSNFLDGPAATINPEIKTVTEAMFDTKIIETIKEAIIATNKNPKVCPSNAAKIQKFTILAADFSVITGELTSTLKLKRSVVAKKYMEKIDAMYDPKNKDAYVPFMTKEEAQTGTVQGELGA